MYNFHKVISIPDDESKFYIHKKTKDIKYCEADIDADYWKPHHMYAVEQSTLDSGDYFVVNKIIFRCGTPNGKTYNKIIAATDTSIDEKIPIIPRSYADNYLYRNGDFLIYIKYTNKCKYQRCVHGSIMYPNHKCKNGCINPISIPRIIKNEISCNINIL